MIELKQGMDAHSLEIVRVGGAHVGYIQWHTDRSPRIVLTGAFSELSLTELDSVISGYKAHRRL